MVSCIVSPTQRFVEHELGQIPGFKQITFVSEVGEGMFEMDGRTIIHPHHTHDEMVAVLQSNVFASTNLAALTVRTFTNEHDPATNLPIKRIRMYQVRNGTWTRVPVQEVQWSQNTCAFTGTPLRREPAVIFE